MKNYLLLLLLTLIAVFINGYTFSTGDQSIHLPLLYRILDNQALAHSYLFGQPEDKFTLFYQLIATIIRLTHVDIQWFYFIAYIVIRCLLTLTIFNLGNTIIRSKLKAMLATALLALPLPIGGTATTTFDTAFMPRFFTLPLLIWSFSQLIQANYFKTAFSAGLILLIHPFSAASLGVILIGNLIFQRQSASKILAVLLTAFLPASPFLVTRLPHFITHARSWLMDPAWYQLLSDRTPYLFLSHWLPVHFISLSLALIVILVWLKVATSHRFHRQIKSILITVLIFTAAYFIASEIIPLTSLIQLQPLRLWLFPAYLAPILLVDLNFNLFSPRLAAIGLSAVLVMFMTYRLITSHAAIEWPHQNQREWDQVQFWIRDNTSKDSLILTPPHRSGFRVHSQRAIVAEIKDGSSGLYSFSFIQEWQRRISQLHWLPTKSTAEIIQIAQQYGADYFVTLKKFPHPSLTPLFQTETFVVYKLP